MSNKQHGPRDKWKSLPRPPNTTIFKTAFGDFCMRCSSGESSSRGCKQLYPLEEFVSMGGNKLVKGCKRCRSAKAIINTFSNLIHNTVHNSSPGKTQQNLIHNNSPGKKQRNAISNRAASATVSANLRATKLAASATRTDEVEQMLTMSEAAPKIRCHFEIVAAKIEQLKDSIPCARVYMSIGNTAQVASTLVASTLTYSSCPIRLTSGGKQLPRTKRW